MSKGGGATESEHQRSRKPSKSNMAPEADADMNWGFRFVVDPLRGVPYRVIRDLELICRFGGSNRAGAASSGVGAQVGLAVNRRKAH